MLSPNARWLPGLDSQTVFKDKKDKVLPLLAARASPETYYGNLKSKCLMGKYVLSEDFEAQYKEPLSDVE